MDREPTLTQAVDVDYERLLAMDLEKARAARDEIARIAARDPERLKTVRMALEGLAASMWSTIVQLHRDATDRTNMRGALALRGLDAQREPAIVVLALLLLWEFFGFNPLLLLGTLAGYGVLAGVSFTLLRRKSQRTLTAARRSLGRDGRDLRFFACQRVEKNSEYPFFGLEGPLDDGALRERRWMISGLNEREAASEPFVEMLDDRAKPIVLSRFPDKTPMIVQADHSNAFIAAYGTYVQRALEQHLPSLRRAGEEFREVVARTARLQAAEDRVLALEAELEDAFRSRAAWKSVVLEPDLEDDLSARAALFRLEEAHTAPMSLLLSGAPGTGKTLVAQTLARASGAQLVTFDAEHVHESFERAREQRSILFLDRCERYLAEGDPGVADAFLREWNDPANAKVWIVAECAHPQALRLDVADHFESEVLVPLPDAPARGRLIGEALKRRRRAAIEAGDELLAATDGMSGRDLDQLVEAADREARDTPLTQAVLLAFLQRRGAALAALDGLDVERGVLVHTRSSAAARDLAAALAHARDLPFLEVTSPDQVLPHEATLFFLAGASAYGDHLAFLNPGQALVVAVPDPTVLDAELRTRLGLEVELPPLAA